MPADTESRRPTDTSAETPGTGRPLRGAWPARLNTILAGPVGSVLVGVLGCLAAFKLRTVPVPTDPWHYVHAGLTFPEMSWNTVGITRYGMVLPMVLVTRLFHDSELAFYLMPVLCTGLLLGLTHWLTRRYFGGVAGVAAAVLVLANSVVLVNASRLYPDLFAVTMTALAVAFAVVARDRWHADGRASRAVVAFLVLTGAAVGLSWWMRETAVFAWPVVLLVLVWKGGPPLRAVVPAAGGAALAFLLMEMAIGQWAFGDAMIRFQALSGADLSQTTNPADLPYLGQTRLAYLAVIPKGMLAFADGWWMIAMGVVAVVGGLVFPRKVGLFAGWFALVFLAFVAIGGALRPDSPNIRLDVVRYWIAFLPPMVIAAVGTVTVVLRLLVDRAGGARWAAVGSPARLTAAVVVALALVAGPVLKSAEVVRANPTYVISNGGVMAQFRNWLHANDHSVRRVFTDWQSERILPSYTRSFTGHRMAHVTWHSLTGERVRPGDYVVLFSAYNGVCYFCNGLVNTAWLPKHEDRLAQWTKVWQTPDRTFVVYRVPPRR